MIRTLEFGAVRLVAAIVSALPMRIVRRIGAGLGRIVYRLDRSRRRTALENLAAAFPSKRERERRALARAMFAHFGSLLLELLKFANYTPDQMRKAVDVEGEERARQAYAQDRGVLFFTGHFGYWEIHAIAEPLINRPISVLARALDNARLNEMLERIRTGTGNSVIYLSLIHI